MNDLNSVDLMGPIAYQGKVIPCSFGSISHLSGSKMIDNRDHLIGEMIENQMTKAPRISKQLVFVTEKLDGMNASVYKKDGKLYPLLRKGYDVRASKYAWIRAFGKYVEFHAEFFDELLHEGERCCGEWLLKQHTVRYEITLEPYAIFDIISGSGNETFHCSFEDLNNRLMDFRFQPGNHRIETYDVEIESPKIVTIDKTVNPAQEVQKLHKYHSKTKSAYVNIVGPLSDTPEGIVLRLEENGKYVSTAKYVTHPYVGNPEYFRANYNDGYNILPGRYLWLYPEDAIVPELGIGV